MVTGSAWRKNNRRELRHSLGRFLAIVAIVALGVGFFAGLKVAQPAMLRTGSQYVQKTELFDYRLVSTLGLTQEDADYFAGLDGVRAAEGARSVDLTAEFEDEGMTLKALTLSDAVNRPSLTAGRMPERADECLADADRFTEADLGKTLTVQAASVDDAFTQTAFTIVGLAETPLYLGAERGTTSLGGGTLNGFVLLQPEAFAMDYFTEIYLLLDGTQGTDLYSDAYDAAVDAVRPALTSALKERAQKRYDDIIDETRDALSKAQKEYNDGLAEYQERRAQTEQELADARTQLDDGAQQLEYNRARLTQAESQLADGEKELEAGQKEYDEGLAAFTQAKQDALDQLDAAQAQIDAGQKQLDDSGILVQYEALQITRRQLTERLASQEPGSAEALLTQGLIEATDLLLRQFEQSEAYQGYLQLQQAQAELDAKRSEAMQTLNEKQAELDAAKQKLEDGKKQLESSRSEIAAGWAAVNAAQAELEQGEADYAAGKAEAEKQFADAEAKLADGRQQLEDAQVEVDKLEHPKSYVLDRSTNTGYVSFENDSSIVAGVAKVFPLFFFAVAALVCITTMTRMIDEQRTQIGTLKALGYSDGTIAWKYMSYSGGAALLGCALGFALGTWIFPLFIWMGYSMLYDFAPVVYVFDGWLLIISVLAALACSAGVTWLSCHAELRENPANLMRPKAPKAGKRILLERIRPLWSRMTFSWKVTARNLFRYKRRFFMAIIGIAGCTALLLTGLGLQNAINDIIDKQYGEVYSFNTIVRMDADEAGQEAKDAVSDAVGSDGQEFAWVSTENKIACAPDGGSEHRLELVCAQDAQQLQRFVQMRERVGGRPLTLDDGGAIISEKLASQLGVSVGDTLTLYDEDDIGNLVGDGHAVTVAGIMENYVAQYAYVTADVYEQAMGKPADFATVYADLGEGVDRTAFSDQLLSMDGVKTVTYSDETIGSYRTMLKTVDSVVVVLVVAAALLAFVVLYNLTNINITERAREIATLKVLGFTSREVDAYIFRETILLSVIGAAIGLVLGVFMEGFVITTAEVDQVMFGRDIHAASFAIAFALTMVFSGIVALAMRGKLRRIDMVESLKSNE